MKTSRQEVFKRKQVTSGSKSAKAVTLSTGETIRWRGNTNAHGSIDAFTVRASDGIATSATPINVNFEVQEANNAPTLSSISPFQIDERTWTEITYEKLLNASNANDEDGDSIEFRIDKVYQYGGYLQRYDGSKWHVSTPVGTILSENSEIKLRWKSGEFNYGLVNGFTVKALDGENTSAEAVDVRFDVQQTNHAPTLTYIADLQTAEDTWTEITYDRLLSASNARDVDNDDIRFIVEDVVSQYGGYLQRYDGSQWHFTTPSGTELRKNNGVKLRFLAPGNRYGSFLDFRSSK